MRPRQARHRSEHGVCHRAFDEDADPVDRGDRQSYEAGSAFDRGVSRVVLGGGPEQVAVLAAVAGFVDQPGITVGNRRLIVGRWPTRG